MPIFRPEGETLFGFFAVSGISIISLIGNRFGKSLLKHYSPIFLHRVTVSGILSIRFLFSRSSIFKGARLMPSKSRFSLTLRTLSLILSFALILESFS